jgi:hypothetical protein
VRDALRCELPASRTRTLLVVDQFEELWTLTPAEQRIAYLDLLLELATPGDVAFTVVLTMRRDYYNLCSAHEQLYARLEANDRRCRYLVGRMQDESLYQIVTQPLKLAGIDEQIAATFARIVLRDVGDRPGDLALVQFALTETWKRRQEHGGDLLLTYLSPEIGRIEGALARAAERVYAQVLIPHYADQDIEAVFIRLVRLGDTGGATRRLARRREFDQIRWSMLQILAEDRGNRLILISGGEDNERAEISHEALVTQWPRFQRWLQSAADHKRTLEALIDRAASWAAASGQEAKTARLATGAERQLFSDLSNAYVHWLSDTEINFVKASDELEKAGQANEKSLQEAKLARAQLERERAEELQRSAERAAKRSRQVVKALLTIFTLAILFAGSFLYWFLRHADERSNIVGYYQVHLGPNGGCPNPTPSNLARIEPLAGGQLRAVNECGYYSAVNYVGPNDTQFWGHYVQFHRIGNEVTIDFGDGNSWVKATTSLLDSLWAGACYWTGWLALCHLSAPIGAGT